ncbi:hypothetical protein ABZZ16_11080 [Streptomyces sp. NPDC006386]|uniref:hypothetical protein n=1 Tax=Streptomyces sp. NPDC006386 TaxID=3156762 RepID=UPI0033B109FB
MNGRTVYLLPPTTSEEANERAGIAMYGLLAHTHDLIDLSWTTRWSPLNPQPEPDLRLTFTGTALTATATTAQAFTAGETDEPLHPHAAAPTSAPAANRPKALTDSQARRYTALHSSEGHAT